ncbi:MAG: hypothetical protein IJT01_10570 [Selenomonadaceae bacterium]|nr:hypothetical protein [Selenomonadaceae bacterium]
MGTIYVVHCIDTEGPLNETIEATFERIERFSGKKLEPTEENLKKIQNGEMDLGGKEESAKYVFSERFLRYNRTWDDFDHMLDLLTSEEYRLRYADSNGNGWKYSWFIVDYVDFLANPRGKELGYHAIYDHYQTYYHRRHVTGDDFQWHAHPLSTYKEAHRCAVSYFNSPHILQSLGRGIIDRGFFPACFRPGFHTERPDSHWLLEQYIPYDYGNQSVALTDLDRSQNDVADGRFGDWRRAPDTWEPYHPSHDDYQVKGNCRRVIFRCLNVGTRLRCITQNEVDRAFQRAHGGEDTVLAITDHDFRHMGEDIDEIYAMIRNAAVRYPDVAWTNSTAYDAARAIMKASCKPIHLSCQFSRLEGKDIVVIEADGDTFGP